MPATLSGMIWAAKTNRFVYTLSQHQLLFFFDEYEPFIN